ncbi:MAG TPA: thermosome subunit beta [Thermoplasmata archaeon]|nr:thermosome subunit beta [Thermoplasmata archaeon]
MAGPGLGNVPVIILREGTTREKGRGAQSNNIAAARAIADAVRSALGPRGMDKMLVDSMGDVTITNDGVTILKEVDVEHPAAKMMVEVAKAQDQECGDGTTTSVVLAGDLLTQAEDLIDLHVHPTVIVAGYRMAAAKAQDLLEARASKVALEDRETLLKIARTAMASKAVGAHKDLLADLAYRAVKAVAERHAKALVVDDDDIQVVKKPGGDISDSELVDGVIVDKERVHTGMPMEISNARIALINAALEVKKTEVSAEIRIRDPMQMQAFLREEENVLKGFADAIGKAGANVVFCQKGIDDLAQHFLSKAGIYAVRRVKESDMKKLARATGARLASKIRELSPSDLGAAKHVEERKIGEDKLTFVTGCKNPRSVSILLRGGTEHVVDEMERSLEDALSVVAVAAEDETYVIGGGAIQMELSLGLKDYAGTVGGREQLAVEKFARALEVVPRTLAENAGMDAVDTLIDLRQRHQDGKAAEGVDPFGAKTADMKKLGVFEPLRVTKQAIASATDAAVMVLRIDDVIASKGPKDTGKGKMPGGGPEGPGEFD